MAGVNNADSCEAIASSSTIGASGFFGVVTVGFFDS
jgi:hypothetical protein